MAQTQHKKAAIVGWPVEHSLSPALHSFWLKELGLGGSYTKLSTPPEKLEEVLYNLQEQGFCGVNLTVPHKEAAIKMMDDMDAMAKKVGAINTIVVRDNGTLFGMNTDVFGFAENLLSANFKPHGKVATLLGAGGAARSAIVALLENGVREIRIMNRTLGRAENLAKEFGPKIHPYNWGDGAALLNIDLLINATSLGLKGQGEIDIDLSPLTPAALVTDMVYNPLQTSFLKRAEQHGCRTLDGLGMLLYQARPAFETFFGHTVKVTPELRAHVIKAMGDMSCKNV